jgi:hypothetical protein
MGEAVLGEDGEEISRDMERENYGPFLMEIQNSEDDVVSGDMIKIEYEDLCVTCHGVLINIFVKAGPTLRGQGKRLAKERRENKMLSGG